MSAGSKCTAETIPHPCVKPSTLVFECPADNPNVSEPVLKSGEVLIHCQICDMAAYQYNDTDGRPGHFGMSIEFGPNMKYGMVDESEVTSYLVYLVDNCSRQLGDVVAIVEKRDDIIGEPETCCLRNAYSVDVIAELPPNVSTQDVALMIVPNTTVGPLAVGVRTDRIIDDNSSAYRRGVLSEASSLRVHRLTLFLVMVFTLALTGSPYSSARDSVAL